MANPANAKFCQECGTSFAPAAGPNKALADEKTPIRVSAEQTADEIPEGERKTVTALFADIKGSMELMEDLDPEEARAIVDPGLKLMIDAARHYDGHIVQSTLTTGRDASNSRQGIASDSDPADGGRC